MGFFVDRLFFVFAEPGFFFLCFFEAFAPFACGFVRVFFGFGALSFIVFGFEPVHEPAQRPCADALRCGRRFAAFAPFAPFACPGAASGERGAGRGEGGERE
jgi:hypothetical protein